MDAPTRAALVVAVLLAAAVAAVAWWAEPRDRAGVLLAGVIGVAGFLAVALWIGRR